MHNMFVRTRARVCLVQRKLIKDEDYDEDLIC